MSRLRCAHRAPSSISAWSRCSRSHSPAGRRFVEPATSYQGWLQAVIRANPVTHAVAAVRHLVQGTSAGGEITWVLLATTILVATFAPVTIHLLDNRE